MEKLEKLIESRLVNEATMFFSLDVDTKFYGRWGTESLGRLIGVLHPGYYQNSTWTVPIWAQSPSLKRIFLMLRGIIIMEELLIGGLVKDVLEVA